MLWDENNLYILQDTRTLEYTTDDFTLNDFVNNTDKVKNRDLGVWSNTSTIQEEHSYYQILLPREMDNLTDAAKRPAAYAVGAIPCLNDAAVEGVEIYECASLGREFGYTSTTASVESANKKRLSHSTLFGAGVRSFVERLDNGAYRTSVVIPWTFLDSTNGGTADTTDIFAKLKKELMRIS
jgi:hypothetical protein